MKKSVMLLLVVCGTMAAFAGARELKKQILGAWVVDEDATVAHYKAGDKAKEKSKAELAQDLKNLRAFMRTADLEFRFRENVLHVTNKGNTVVHPITVNRASGKVIIFDSSIKSLRTHQAIQFRVTFQDKDHIAITSSDGKDLDVYIWRRLPPKK